MLTPVIGWTCCYVPEEIIYAAGFHSCRITGNYEPTSIVETYMPSNVCPFSRNIIDCGLQGKYKYLSGMIMTNCCQASEFTYDIWNKYIDTDFVYLLDIPRKINNVAFEFFKNRLIKLVEKLENHYHINIEDKSLKQSVLLFNKTRILMNEIYELRKNDDHFVTCSKMTEVINRSYTMPRVEYNCYLEAFIESQKILKKPIEVPKKKRILLIGSKMSHNYIVEVIENFGAAIVYEDMCSFKRPYNDIIDINSDDIIGAIAHRYLSKRPCARMFDTGTMSDNIANIIDEYKIDGVVYHVLKFCSSNIIKGAEIRERIRGMGIPFQLIEGDYTFGSIEQIRTRINTFLEII